ncbi:hypothetical protein ACO2Q9_11235 [Variovorax sp. VNK109]|uniref:hypothetical protein n=1 Tax=Variovorax sp. VNK109 TaxID=3400919 RepID=UPI003C026C12
MVSDMHASGPVLSYGDRRRSATLPEVDPIGWTEELLAVGGIDAALAFLNTRVEHRSSAIYRLAGSKLHLTHYFDASGNRPLAILEHIPLGDSFCQFALRDGSFYVEESRNDIRISRTPLPPVMSSLIASYVGFPMLSADSSFIGTLCHFDIVARSITSAEMDVQRRAAAILSTAMG